ncbi:c-type cytochrome biogenesis protein CcsB [Plantactinospora mayteni]|uniref:C-type cytochrome biogenesis protein CcsB n=1 Tax=Plantactinospora mayteni TaxID=566021 RepID=A0ABQ4F1T2_9ACTN|nr:c-type cytochrome biogenesis protein CcsB [Plantactinospora mayteni]GIH00860.1 c-type cytochrome biogenesis protein CcsB [Plantactinospora mayteni]
MAQLSDQLFVVSLFCHLVAMIGYAAAYAVNVRAPHRRLLTVGAAGDPATSGDTVGPVTREAAPVQRWAGGVAVVATIAAALAQAGALTTRGLAAERVPWGNMYEFILAVTLAGVLAWLAVLRQRPELQPLGLYVATSTLILLGLAGLRVYTPAGPLVPALNSTWLKIHVSTAALASGVFLLGFVTATAYLIAVRPARPGGLVSTLARRLPAPAALERLTFRLHAFAFPIWTFAVIAGAIWAEASWGRYWGWDPKETWAFISWVSYAAYLHARATASVRRTTTAWLAIAGWATMMFNLFAVNLVIAGLHSYAGA